MENWKAAMRRGDIEPVDGTLIADRNNVGRTLDVVRDGLDAAGENPRACCLGVHILVNEDADFARCKGVYTTGGEPQFGNGETLNHEAAQELDLHVAITAEELEDLLVLPGINVSADRLRDKVGRGESVYRMDALVEINDGHIASKPREERNYLPIVEFIEQHGWDKPGGDQPTPAV